MLQQKRVKSAVENDDDSNTLNHETKVSMDLGKSCKNSNRIVCAESYFASVQCATELLKWRLKLSHKDYPLDFLVRMVLQRRGR
jgi:hypothetical protein